MQIAVHPETIQPQGKQPYFSGIGRRKAEEFARLHGITDDEAIDRIADLTQEEANALNLIAGGAITANDASPKAVQRLKQKQLLTQAGQPNPEYFTR